MYGMPGVLAGLTSRRPDTLLGATAALISRLYLPPMPIAVSWSVRTGQIRAAGKLFYVFYALACLLWVAASLALCLLVRFIVSLYSAQFALQPAGVKGVWAIVISKETRAILNLISSSSPWLGFALWTTLGFALYGAERWLWHARKTYLGFLISMPIGAMLSMAYNLIGLLAVISLYVAAFPGLVDGSPASIFPWWAWFAVAWGLLIYRGSSPLNPRLREFTSGLQTSAYWHDFGQHRTLHEHAVAVFVGMRARLRGASSEDCKRLVDEALGALPFHELEEMRFRFLKTCKSFYEREGLSTVLRVGSRERRYYTAAQCDALDKAYSEIAESIAHRERLLRLKAEGYFANSMSREESDEPQRSL